MDGNSISAWRTGQVQALSAAQYNGDEQTITRIVADLQALHVALGLRQVGTREEQNTYILARSTNTPLPELAAVGINTNDWPAPPTAPAAPESHASPATELRISRMFEAAGRLSDERPPDGRYAVQYRPQDDQRYRGMLLPWAICDTTLRNRQGEPLPVSHHAEKELAEYQADLASERYASLGQDRR